MARPIDNIEKLTISPQQQQERDIQTIETALADNKQAVLEGLTLLNHLHESGLPNMANSAFDRGDDVLHIMIEELNKPHNAKALGNLLRLLELLGTLDIDNLQVLASKANQGMYEAVHDDSHQDPEGVFQLMKALKEPEVSHSLGLLLNFLRGMGKSNL